jgi:hypothetical protein
MRFSREYLFSLKFSRIMCKTGATRDAAREKIMFLKKIEFLSRRFDAVNVDHSGITLLNKYYDEPQPSKELANITRFKPCTFICSDKSPLHSFFLVQVRHSCFSHCFCLVCLHSFQAESQRLLPITVGTNRRTQASA